MALLTIVERGLAIAVAISLVAPAIVGTGVEAGATGAVGQEMMPT
jgi:hypothetical protein